jgi:hypothetical protein
VTVRDHVLDKLQSLFQKDDAAVEALTDTELENADELLGAFDVLSDSLETLFAEDSGTFIHDVKAVLDGLRALHLDVGELLPRHQNLVLALQIANSLTIEQLDLDLPAEWTDFGIHEISEGTGLRKASGENLNSFSYFNIDSIKDSICYLDLRGDSYDWDANDLDELTNIAIICVMKICEAEMHLDQKMWILTCTANTANHSSLLKYHALLQGYLLTEPLLSPAYHGTEGISAKVQYDRPYVQFTEPFEMLNEINGRKTVIDAFLSSYHTLENYMIRSRIAEVERSHNSSTFFSIRQFKRVHSAIDKNELEQLKSLIKVCWGLEIGGQLVREYVDARFAALAAYLAPDGLQEAGLMSFLQKLGIPASLQPPGDDQKITALSRLIYQIRCSIVHNKETEFHISNKELQADSARSLITEFCIPVMRRISFGMPSMPAPNPIMYSRKEITLY